MTHKERMAALVEAGEKATQGHIANCPGGTLQSTHDILAHVYSYDNRAFFAQAANARPSIALAAEGMKALKEWRECERQMNNVPNDTNDYHNAYNAMGAAWRRLDALLERWEGKE